MAAFIYTIIMSTKMEIIKERSWSFAFILVFFIGCVSQEEGPRLSEKPVSEIFTDMEKLPPIEDPDPLIEELVYGEIFSEAYLMRVLTDVSSEDPMPLYLKNLLRSIGEEVGDLAPEAKDRFENASLNDLVGILDPRVPLDPPLEELLKELLEKLKADLSLAEVPTVEGLEELKAAEEYLEFEESSMSSIMADTLDDSCARDVFTQYAAGARACGNELNFALGLIKSNYLRRVLEAGERFESRNDQLKNFELEQLPVVVEVLREVLAAIRKAGTPEEIKEIRANIGYFAAVYAYHLRNDLPRWHQYGLELNEWYYYKELELFAGIRLAKEAEADSAYGHCIDWINGQITEEVTIACPGESPILY